MIPIMMIPIMIPVLSFASHFAVLFFLAYSVVTYHLLLCESTCSVTQSFP